MSYPTIYSREQLLRLDEKQDVAITGFVLAEYRQSSYAADGAHDPTATPYFILDELFGLMDFDESSHLLDVGCGSGRVLAFFVDRNIPGAVTGVELDTGLASKASRWASRDNINVINASVLDIDLSDYSHIYLFNPFDSPILVKFIEKVEREATRPITVCHMSDNGETFYYLARDGWARVHQGEFQKIDGISLYGHPQHYTIWSYCPE